MTNKLISLVIIIFILSVGRSYSDEQFLFPKKSRQYLKKLIKTREKVIQVIYLRKTLTNEEKSKEKISQKNKK